MLKNYFKIAWRNLVRNKVYSLINVAGLAVGLAASMLIFLWVSDELSYDRYHSNAHLLYRSIVHWRIGDQEAAYTTTPAPFAAWVKENIPEVDRVCRFNLVNKTLFAFKDKLFIEPGGAYVDPSTFDMFTYEFISGNPLTALNDPSSLVLSETLARKYFGNRDALGEIIKINDKHELVVKGVYKDMPENSHLRFQFLLPFELFVDTDNIGENNWSDFNYYTYLQLKPHTSKDQAGKKISALIGSDFPDAVAIQAISLQPLTKIHLYSDFDLDSADVGNINYVYIFSAIAVFILLIACINFMNLATARSVKRAKEVGLRKAIGAGKGQLVGQFLGESMLICCIAAALAVLLLELFLPAYNTLAQKQMIIRLLDGDFVMIILLTTVLTSLLSGIYPALVLSSFRPAKVLKGKARTGKDGALFRKILVVLQFSLSLLLIIGTLVIRDQLQYMQHKKLGFDKDNVLVVGRGPDHYQTFKNSLLQQPGILHVTSGSQDISDVASSTLGAQWEGRPRDKNILLNQLSVDRDFVKTFGINIVSGRGFSSELRTDSSAFILNEEAVRQMGLESPVGTSFSLHGVDGTVIGVAEDFHFQSLHQVIAPMVLFVSPNWRSKIYIKINSEKLPEAIAAVESLWNEIYPDNPFDYRFLDENFDAIYRAETRTSQLFDYFAAIAIFISCLGLLGLTAYMAEQRTKEIGLRKVMGASEKGIVLLFSREFMKLIFIAFVITAPVAWYVMSRWLEDFAYRTEINMGAFLMAGSFSFCIALLTVGYQAIKAALADPVDSLRNE